MKSKVTRRYFLETVIGAGSILVISMHLPIVFEKDLVRPPGAVKEKYFNSLCIRCGKCVEICPTGVIVFSDIFDGFNKVGTPKIDAMRGSCEAIVGRCEDNPRCINHCPTEALSPLGNQKIGYASLDRSLCISWEGVDCLICYEVCPVIGAISLTNDGKPLFNRDVCVGCGKCVFACPVEPKALDLLPEYR